MMSTTQPPQTALERLAAALTAPATDASTPPASSTAEPGGDSSSADLHPFLGVDAAGKIHTTLETFRDAVTAAGTCTAQPTAHRVIDFDDGASATYSDLLGAPALALVIAVGDQPVVCLHAADARYFSADELKELDEIRRANEEDFSDCSFGVLDIVPGEVRTHPKFLAIAAEPRIVLTRNQAQRAPWDVVTPPPGELTIPDTEVISSFTVGSEDAEAPLTVTLVRDTRASAFPDSPYTHLVVGRGDTVMLVCGMLPRQ